jgi:2,3-bisphosphoglycerate-dependent phosphoglycerate mutase
LGRGAGATGSDLTLTGKLAKLKVFCKVPEGSPFLSGLSQTGRTLRVMVFDTLPSPALGAAAAAGPVAWLVRHGESTWNALGLAQGHSDQPRLTRQGARQARYVASQLRGRPIGAVYASDLRRAAATAAPLAAALGLTVNYDPRLRERGLGVLEGTRSVTVPAALSGVDGTRVIDPDARPPDGESLRDLYWRVAGFADDLLTACQPDRAGQPERRGGPPEVAVVAHGGTLRVLTAYLRGVPVERMAWEPIGNGCVVRLQPDQYAHS